MSEASELQQNMLSCKLILGRLPKLMKIAVLPSPTARQAYIEEKVSWEQIHLDEILQKKQVFDAI